MLQCTCLHRMSSYSQQAPREGVRPLFGGDFGAADVLKY